MDRGPRPVFWASPLPTHPMPARPSAGLHLTPAPLSPGRPEALLPLRGKASGRQISRRWVEGASLRQATSYSSLTDKLFMGTGSNDMRSFWQKRVHHIHTLKETALQRNSNLIPKITTNSLCGQYSMWPVSHRSPDKVTPVQYIYLNPRPKRM